MEQWGQSRRTSRSFGKRRWQPGQQTQHSGQRARPLGSLSKQFEQQSVSQRAQASRHPGQRVESQRPQSPEQDSQKSASHPSQAKRSSAAIERPQRPQGAPPHSASGVYGDAGL